MGVPGGSAREQEGQRAPTPCAGCSAESALLVFFGAGTIRCEESGVEAGPNRQPSALGGG
jgi:hypothetical protein